jgi:lipoyl synthase
MSTHETKPKRRKPPWLKRPLPQGEEYYKTAHLLDDLKLNTICQEALCPNIGECWSRRIATILIMGSKCTRGCKFCGVSTLKPDPLDPTEPDRLAEAVRRLGLSHVVVTSVTRDDLKDGGAGHIAGCLRKVHEVCPKTSVELLSSDFRGNWEGLPEVLDAGVDIWGHNMETVPRLYSKIRPGARYERSLEIFRSLRKLDSTLPLKSAMMLGVGETEDEVRSVLEDLRSVDVDRLTLGQYLSPTKQHQEVIEYIHPDQFKWWKEQAGQMGFTVIESHPFARSSYYGPEAAELLKDL